MSFWLSIDPGINTGIALWADKHLKDVSELNTKTRNIAADIEYLGRELDFYLARQRVEKAYIEYPALWMGSQTSMASAASGDLVKLAVIVGALAAVLQGRGATIHFLSPSAWKGQLSKSAVEERVRRRLETTFGSTHKNDAVGIGLHILGQFSEQPVIKAFSNLRKRSMK